jgi:hypothetical protein
MATGRTDPYVVVVMNHDTFERFQHVGTKKECEAFAAAKQKEFKGADTEVLIQKR